MLPYRLFPLSRPGLTSPQKVTQHFLLSSVYRVARSHHTHTHTHHKCFLFSSLRNERSWIIMFHLGESSSAHVYSVYLLSPISAFSQCTQVVVILLTAKSVVSTVLLQHLKTWVGTTLHSNRKIIIIIRWWWIITALIDWLYKLVPTYKIVSTCPPNQLITG